MEEGYVRRNMPSKDMKPARWMLSLISTCSRALDELSMCSLLLMSSNFAHWPVNLLMSHTSSGCNLLPTCSSLSRTSFFSSWEMSTWVIVLGWMPITRFMHFSKQLPAAALFCFIHPMMRLYCANFWDHCGLLSGWTSLTMLKITSWHLVQRKSDTVAMKYAQNDETTIKTESISRMKAPLSNM